MSTDYKQMTKNFEGIRYKPYKCSAGKTTIGYGRNLDDVGISQAEADMLFDNDWFSATEDVNTLLKAYSIDENSLSEGRKYVLTDMMFNLGYSKLSKFKNMLTALKKQDYATAAKEMMSSAWATQVKTRATKLRDIMIKG
jgi:lysozyme